MEKIHRIDDVLKCALATTVMSKAQDLDEEHCISRLIYAWREMQSRDDLLPPSLASLIHFVTDVKGRRKHNMWEVCARIWVMCDEFCSEAFRQKLHALLDELDLKDFWIRRMQQLEKSDGIGSSAREEQRSLLRRQQKKQMKKTKQGREKVPASAYLDRLRGTESDDSEICMFDVHTASVGNVEKKESAKKEVEKNNKLSGRRRPTTRLNGVEKQRRGAKEGHLRSLNSLVGPDSIL